MAEREPGWYPAEGGTFETYWDGSKWIGEARPIERAADLGAATAIDRTPGWYPSPDGDYDAYWSGVRWTGKTRPRPVVQSSNPKPEAPETPALKRPGFLTEQIDGKQALAILAIATVFIAGIVWWRSAGGESARDRYLAVVEQTGFEFVSDEAALMYLRSTCESPTRGAEDAVDVVVYRYCADEGALDDLGIAGISHSVPDNVDEAAFRQQAEQEFDVGVPHSDGSYMDAVLRANEMCTNSEWMRWSARLGDDWDDSFERFAVEQFCPDQLGDAGGD